jgi:CheY-like chemotaxis protein
MFQNTAIVMVSASAFNQDRHLSIAVGCNDFITKPIDPDVLFKTMRSLLNLEWQHKDVNIVQSVNGNLLDKNVDAIVQAMVAPPISMVEKLLQFARMGDILSIQDEVILLQDINPVFIPFASQILDYSREFQVKRIREFLEAQLSKP